MKVTLRQFRMFIATAETGQISKAARSIYTSQSVVTEAIKSLEKEMDVNLFKRHAKGVTLTSEGIVFLRHARHVLAAATEAVQAPQRRKQDMRGTLTLACVQTVMAYYLPAFLGKFQREHPGVQVKLVEMTRKGLEAALIRNDIDLAMCLTAPLQHVDEFCIRHLARSPRRLWLPVNHPLLDKQPIYLSDLKNEPYVQVTIDDAEEVTREYWEVAGLEPNVYCRTVSIEAVRNLVAVGAGITILSDMVYRPWTLENDRLNARTLADPIPGMDIGFAWNRGTRLSGCAEAFVNTCGSAREWDDKIDSSVATEK